jgi:hypothetical protein
MGTNIPRVTYPVGGGCGALLLEKQSTNLALYSEALSTSPNIVDSSTATANVYISPNGTQNAMQFTETTANDRHGFYQYTTVTAQTYTASIFTKQTGRRYIAFNSDMTNGTNSASYFDLQTKSVVSSGSGHTCSIQDFGNGWLRLIVTLTVSAGAAGSRYVIWGGSPNGSTYIYAGSTSFSQTFWGYQFEASTYSTSYISTTSSSATRIADSCYKTGISNLFGTNQGTFFIDFVYIGQRESLSSFPYIFDILNASLNRLIMYGSATNTGYDTYDLWDSTNSVLGNMNLYYNTRYKIAVKYSSSGVVCYVNGSLAVNSTASFNPQMSGFYLARRYSDTEINSLKVNQNLLFPITLTNAELATLTTL